MCFIFLRESRSTNWLLIYTGFTVKLIKRVYRLIVKNIIKLTEKYVGKTAIKQKN